jgi:hypothetical protein
MKKFTDDQHDKLERCPIRIKSGNSRDGVAINLNNILDITPIKTRQLMRTSKHSCVGMFYTQKGKESESAISWWGMIVHMAMGYNQRRSLVKFMIQ